MVTTAAIAEIGALLGDPARVNMMIALLDGRALTGRELAELAGVSPQTASSHLHKLITAGMIDAIRQGRHRYHRLASPEVARLLEQMHVAGASLGMVSPRNRGPRDAAMREARSCYDHLAGRIATEISMNLLGHGPQPEKPVRLLPRGLAMLETIGIDITKVAESRRCFCRTCIDWSERRPHVAGAVGAAMLQTLFERGWLHRQSGTRALSISATGEQGFRQVFRIDAVRSG